MRKQLSCLLILFAVAGFFLGAEEQKKEMTLKEAIFHALKNNLDLQIQMTDVTLAHKDLKINKSIFIPTLNLTGSTSESNSPASGALSGADVEQRNSLSLDVGISQRLPWGGTVSFDLSNSRGTNNLKWSTFDPTLSSTGRLQLRQPLLKNFGLTATKYQIHVSTNNLKGAKHQLRQNIIDLIFNVEQSYWNLVYAIENLKVSQMALQRAKDQLRQNEIKVKVGSAPRIDILSAQAQVASNESSLISAEKRLQSAEVNLKRILNMSTQDVSVIPTETPQIKKMDVDFKKFLLEALNNRPDVERAKLDLANFKIGVKYARNQMLPSLELTATYFTTGQGGTQYALVDPTRTPFTAPDFNRDNDMYVLASKSVWGTMDDVFSRLYKNYNIQLGLTIPLSFSKEKAEVARAKINLKRALLSLKNVENTVYSDLKEAIKEMEANGKLMDANRIAEELQAKQLEAEEKKLSVGISTNFNVFEYQRQYATAQVNALQSLIDYNLTLAKINKSLARTLAVYDIKLKDYIEK